MPSLPGPHTGILRTENIALRHLLGYNLSSIPLSPYPPPPISETLPNSPVKDVLFVAIDVDTGGGYEVISPGQTFHIGVSIFDTRWLVERHGDPKDAVKAYQFVNVYTKITRRAARGFHQGPTHLLPLPHFAARFKELTHNRRYVLIGHGLDSELKFLQNLSPSILTSAVCILDTVKVSQHILGLFYRYNLQEMLDELGIRYGRTRFHVGGNDAFWALRGVLGLAGRDWRQGRKLKVGEDGEDGEKGEDGEGEVLRRIERVAYAGFVELVWIDEPPGKKKVKTGIKEQGRRKKAFKELPFNVRGV